MVPIAGTTYSIMHSSPFVRHGDDCGDMEEECSNTRCATHHPNDSLRRCVCHWSRQTVYSHDIVRYYTHGDGNGSKRCSSNDAFDCAEQHKIPCTHWKQKVRLNQLTRCVLSTAGRTACRKRRKGGTAYQHHTTLFYTVNCSHSIVFYLFCQRLYFHYQKKTNLKANISSNIS